MVIRSQVLVPGFFHLDCELSNDPYIAADLGLWEHDSEPEWPRIASRRLKAHRIEWWVNWPRQSRLMNISKSHSRQLCESETLEGSGA